MKIENKEQIAKLLGQRVIYKYDFYIGGSIGWVKRELKGVVKSYIVGIQNGPFAIFVEFEANNVRYSYDDKMFIWKDSEEYKLSMNPSEARYNAIDIEELDIDTEYKDWI